MTPCVKGHAACRTLISAAEVGAVSHCENRPSVRVQKRPSIPQNPSVVTLPHDRHEETAFHEMPHTFARICDTAHQTYRRVRFHHQPDYSTSADIHR